MFMTTHRSLHVLAVVLATSLGLAHSARAQSAADTVVEWNRILLTALAVPGANPPTVFITRPIAMMHVAMFDALNSLDPQYDFYATRAAAPSGASQVAAAAQAAHDVLVALLPTQRASFDAALSAALAPIPATAASDGSLVGAAAARAILDLRANDGWSQTPPPYLLPDLAGYWQPTPPANAAAAFTHYPYVRGFIVSDARQLLVEPPPALTSSRYAADFNEVKAIGSATSATRTAVETQTAQLWAAVGTTTNANAAWNIALQDLTRTRGLTGLEAARMFALANMAAHDALLVSFTGKYTYGLWRPVTAIRGADRDGNAATEPDGTWSSLIVSPPYPTYPGNMACLGASQAQVLTRFFGRDNIPVSITWAVAGGTGITRSYNGFRQIADEEARSRILGGIHFTFDTLASFGVCVPLGDYTVSNYLRPRFSGR
jgi:hypothetical protein